MSWALPRNGETVDSYEEKLVEVPAESLYRRTGKRLFDLAGGSVLLALFAPLIGFVLAAVAFEGGRPIFSHERVGLRGRRFRCFKFRTMVRDADEQLAELLHRDPAAAAEWALHQKLENDPRITRLGHFLRRSSLDELPQLWNVVRGDMSLVGPRPITDEELKRYGNAARLYLSVRPGLTGFWQVNDRNSGSGTNYDARVSQDIKYISSISLTEDLKILLATVSCVLRMTGR